MFMKTRIVALTMLLLTAAVVVPAQGPQQPAGGARGGGAGARGGGQQPEPMLVPSEEKAVTVTAIPGVIAAGARWQTVWQGADNADGIVGTDDGGLLFAQEQPNTIRKLDRNDWDSVYAKNTNGTGAIAVDAQGRIFAVQRTCSDPGRDIGVAAKAIPACTDPTKVAIIYPERDRRVLADNFNGMPLGRVNDITVSRNGTVYFNGGGRSYYLKPGDKVMSIGDNVGSNGILLSPDERTLYLTRGAQNNATPPVPAGLTAFTVQPDGTPTNPRNFVNFQGGGGGDGLAVDSEGRIYVTGPGGGVQVVSPDGRVLGTIPTPRGVITVAFSGPDKKTLYVVGSGMNAPNGGEFVLAPGYRNNAKTIYKIPMIATGFKGRAK
jgi:gluconolactonase